MSNFKDKLIEKLSITTEKFTYVCAQTGLTKDVEVQKYNNLSQKEQMEHYLNIGHDNTLENELWILIPGKGIQTAKGGEGVFHHVIWPHMSMTTTYRGRVQHNSDGTTIVSMSPPFRSDPDTINSLIPKLYAEFSADKVMVFN